MTETINQPRPDANDVLMGGGDGVKGATFAQPGQSVEGVVCAPPKAREEREFNQVTKRSDGPVKTFPSGDPIYGILIDLQTQERDPMDPEDDGQRRLYVEGKRFKEAIRNAVSAAGGRGVEVGGYLKVTYTHQEAAGTVMAKCYAAEYRTPANQGLMSGQPQAAAPVAQPTVAAPVAAQPVAQVPQSVPAPAPAPAAAPAATDGVSIARQMFAIPGMSDAQVAAASGLAEVVVAALRAQG